MAFVRTRSIQTRDVGSSNVLTRAVGDAYAVDGFEPELAFDFTGETYRTDGSATTFSGAMTHSATSLGTMVDGYGPELVVNGDFDTNVNGWDYASFDTATWESGTARIDRGASGNGSAIYQDGATSGVIYEVTATYTNLTGTILVNEVENITTAGTHSFLYTASSSRLFSARCYASSGVNIDNISVREVPALKWRPHNLLTYSEDFTDASWTKTNTTITASSINSPDGDANGSLADATTTGNGVSKTATIVADSTNTCSFYVKYNSAQWIRIVLYEAANSTNRVTFWADVLNGVLGSATSGGTGSGATGNIENVGNGWYRLSLSGAVNNSATSVVVQISNASSDGVTNGTTDDYYIWGAHLYRSDLGGMVDNPDRGDSYVPTTSAAVYLPRRGHYVYNDQAWTNRGLLHESEARTNEITYSQDFTDASWSKVNTGTLAVDATGPDGGTSAVTLVDNGAGGTGAVYVKYDVTVSTSTTYTASVFAKADQLNFLLIYLSGFTTPASDGYYFNLTDGTTSVYTSGTGIEPNVEDIGNGWYRCSLTFTTDAADSSGQVRFYIAEGTALPATVDLDGTSSILIYGAQLEAGSTPSSYMPTNGATFTRAAETLTVAAANLPYPTPNIVGSELVTNGTFDSDTDWTKGTGWSIGSGVATATGSTSDTFYLEQNIGLVSGKVYQYSIDVGGTVTGSNYLALRFGGTSDNFTITSTGVKTGYVVASGSGNLRIRSEAATTDITVDNISVKEMQPLAVGIHMQGTMTYADTDNYEAYFHRWYLNSNTYIQAALDATSTRTGMPRFFQNTASYTAVQLGGIDSYSPGINVPFNIASRHGSTFINGAVDGTALTEDTTPTALPDLSATDLELGYDFMGTIDEFRMWGSMDIGDTTIAQATAPSLEPSLALFFHSGDTSFTVRDWK